MVPFVALVALSVGVASVSGADGVGFAMVQGKGTVDFGAPAATEVAIVAVRAPSGVVNGHVVQTDPGFGETLLQVTCVRPSTFTTRVAVGGVIVSSYATPMIGLEAIYIVDDLSSLGGGQVDQLGGAGIGPGASTCPFDPGYVANPLETLVSGDFKLMTH
jgi:hypothetical protein